MDRRSFLSYGTMAAASVLARGTFRQASAQDLGNSSPSAVVHTTAGRVRGITRDKVNAFFGIPYGASTAGPRRFMPPAKPDLWTGIREAVEFGPKSPQGPWHFLFNEGAQSDRREPASEDCLVLNVWTRGPGSGPRPVMVWLHGGAFTQGSGAMIIWDGENLARRHDVVVVTLNHRLDAFGFLYLAQLGGEKYANSSNVGMQDIVAALEWVRDNIAEFGGDPKNVTIFGQSGGGAKVSTVLAMPSAKGLFHRAIVESGAWVKGLTKDAATKTAETYLGKLGMKPDQIDDLQNVPVDRLVAALGAPEFLTSGDPGLNWGPVVDGHYLPRNPFDPDAPETSANIPLLVGTTETEVAGIKGMELEPMDDAALHAHVKQVLRVADDSAVDRLIGVYRKGRPGASNTDLYLILDSDATWRAGAMTEAERKADQGAAPAYVYYFTWRSPVRDGKLRSFHTLEIPFVFDNVDLATGMTGSGQERYALEDKISGAWVAFARTGNPNHNGLPNWPTFNTTQRATMILDNECKVVNDPHGEERRALAAARQLPG